MIHSMTGYASASADSPQGRLNLELRSVNSRFLDVQFRVAEELRALEPLLRELIAARISRGKVDCRLFLNESADAAGVQGLNPDALGRLKLLSGQAAKAFPDAAPLHLADILRWPGMISQPLHDEGKLRATVQKLCESALGELLAARAREGEKLAAVIAGRIGEMRRRVEAVAPLIPQSVAAYRAKLEERLREAIGSLASPGTDERIRTEIALFAGKVDVDEELERLRAHFDEVERILKQGGASGKPPGQPVGKRLDFMAQELNREANTLASKAASAPVSECALELKLLTEQVREQVQNIE
jgi:uncharacterized protein (TIGR00255 family)